MENDFRPQIRGSKMSDQGVCLILRVSNRGAAKPCKTPFSKTDRNQEVLRNTHMFAMFGDCWPIGRPSIIWFPNVPRFLGQKFIEYIMVHQMSMLRHLQLSFETSLLMAAASSNWNGYWQIPHAEKVPSSMDIPVPDNSRVMQFSIQSLASNIRNLWDM